MILDDSEIIVCKSGVGYAVDVEWYPNGEPLIKSCYGGNTLVVRAKSIETFIAAMFYADQMRWRGFPFHNLMLPLVPGSRQDRLNHIGGDLLFTLKSIANMINERKFEKVCVVDPHSYVTPALIDNCEVLDEAPNILFENKYTCVVAPDAGAAKRAEKFAKFNSVPLVQGFKTRDMTTGRLSGFGIEDVDPSIMMHPLLVDDLCDGGGTFLGLGEEIERVYHPNSMDLYVTHGLFTKGVKDLLAMFDEIHTTDSVVEQPQGITVHPVVERFTAWASTLS